MTHTARLWWKRELFFGWKKGPLERQDWKDDHKLKAMRNIRNRYFSAGDIFPNNFQKKCVFFADIVCISFYVLPVELNNNTKSSLTGFSTLFALSSPRAGAGKFFFLFFAPLFRCFILRKCYFPPLTHSLSLFFLSYAPAALNEKFFNTCVTILLIQTMGKVSRFFFLCLFLGKKCSYCSLKVFQKVSL